MKKMTVNEAMVLTKTMRGRLGELSSLRAQCSTRETYFGDKGRVIEPTYDMKILDKKCVLIENFLFEVDRIIKQSNAVTVIEVDADVKDLLSPLQ